MPLTTDERRTLRGRLHAVIEEFAAASDKLRAHKTVWAHLDAVESAPAPSEVDPDGQGHDDHEHDDQA
jgi:hypothetical protein